MTLSFARFYAVVVLLVLLIDFSLKQVDENYVGEPPKVEVTIENLNDNVDKAFLQSMVSKFGAFEEMVIHYHPVTKKHLGLARLVFEEVKSAKECVKSLHCKSVMGKSLNCYIDPFGSSCKKMFTDLTTEKKPEAPPPPPPPPEDSPPITAEEIKKSLSLGDDKMKKHRDHHHHASSPPSRSEESKWGGGSGSSGHHRDRDPRGYDHPRESRHSRERGDRRRSDYNHDRHDYPSHSSRDSSSRHYSDRDRDSGRDLRDGNSRDSSRDDRDHHHHHNRSSSRDYSRHSSSENRDYLQVQQQPPPPLQQQQYEGDQQLPPEYWLQQAQQFAAQAQKHSSRANSQDSDQGLPPLPPSLHHPRLHEQQQMSSPHVPHVQHIPAPLGEPPDLHQDLAGSPPPGNNEDEGGGGGLNLIPSSSGQLATAALNNSDDGGDSDSNNKVDLDTRLKMLMTSGPDNIPAFLQFDKSDSESEQEEEKPALVEEEMEALAPPQYLVTAAHLSQMFPLEPDEVPLSRPPSPFIGTEEYHQCHKQWLEEKRARTNPHGGNNGRLSRQSDKMSLSSLSSEDNKILEQGPDTSYPPPPPGYHGYYPPGYPGSQWPAAPPPPPPGGDYASHHQYYSQHHPGYDSTYPYAMGEEFYGHDGQKWGETQGGYPPGQKYTKDTFRPILE